MDEPDLFNATVSSLYQTVLEPERWTEAIYNVAHLFEASTASMFDYDLVNQTPSHFRIFGHDGSVERAYSSSATPLPINSVPMPPLLSKSRSQRCLGRRAMTLR